MLKHECRTISRPMRLPPLAVEGFAYCCADFEDHPLCSAEAVPLHFTLRPAVARVALFKILRNFEKSYAFDLPSPIYGRTAAGDFDKFGH